jgi:pSer/pThr/pTyr-binding forkhead associated (FHA) protein
MPETVSVDELLLVLQVAFLALLYLFIWRIVRSASRDIQLPQESFVLAQEGGARTGGPGALVVERSPTLPPGEEHPLNSRPLTIGRSAENDIELRGDDFASSVHARFEARPDGVWVADLRSTNGTFVNGVRLDGARKLAPGDVVRVGETDLRYDG